MLTAGALREARGRGSGRLNLVFLFVRRDWLQIFRFEDLAAVKTLNVLDPVSARQHYCPGMFTGGLRHGYRTHGKAQNSSLKTTRPLLILRG